MPVWMRHFLRTVCPAWMRVLRTQMHDISIPVGASGSGLHERTWDYLVEIFAVCDLYGIFRRICRIRRFSVPKNHFRAEGLLRKSKDKQLTLVAYTVLQSVRCAVSQMPRSSPSAGCQEKRIVSLLNMLFLAIVHPERTRRIPRTIRRKRFFRHCVPQNDKGRGHDYIDGGLYRHLIRRILRYAVICCIFSETAQ